MQQEFERAFEPASVSGYLDRLSKEIIIRLAKKGIHVNTLIHNGDNFIIQMTDHYRRSGVFQVSCINNSIIEWRRYA